MMREKTYVLYIVKVYAVGKRRKVENQYSG